MTNLHRIYIDALGREVDAGLHPGIEVQKPDGSMALVNAVAPTIGDVFMYGEQCDEPPQPMREQCEAWAARNGMVMVPRAEWADLCALMPGKRGPEPADFPANALRPLQGEKWRG